MTDSPDTVWRISSPIDLNNIEGDSLAFDCRISLRAALVRLRAAAFRQDPGSPDLL